MGTVNQQANLTACSKFDQLVKNTKPRENYYVYQTKQDGALRSYQVQASWHLE